MAAQAPAPMITKPPSIPFLRPLKSAIVPRIGESTAMIAMLIVVTRANSRDAASGLMPSQATLE